MKIFSSAFGEGEMIPIKFTCDGENINPELKIQDVPFEAKSLVLVMHDDDAPVEGGWTHWVIFNMKPESMTIVENSIPQSGVEAQTSSGKSGYKGPCPPSGTHHYEFRLYALDAMLDLDENANKGDLEKAMEGHVVEKVVMTGLYERKAEKM